MINFDAFKDTIKLLEKNKVQYWVFGGFALDGLRGKITREHNDIDIYLHSDDLSKLKQLSNSKRYRFYKRENMYFIESTELKLGVVILTEEDNLIVAHGNKTLAKYPKEIFSKDMLVSIGTLQFRIVPLEILYLESKFSKFETDKTYGRTIKINKKLFNKIKTIKIRD
jgi:phosphorylcholine metabolism protein LicD